ncbi:hypothetical protein CK934_02850 [Chitinophaga sp. MD30]|nr:hypothetical protein CK934_02850 [Chitinophaga sp. MD30]
MDHLEFGNFLYMNKFTINHLGCLQLGKKVIMKVDVANTSFKIYAKMPTQPTTVTDPITTIITLTTSGALPVEN